MVAFNLWAWQVCGCNIYIWAWQVCGCNTYMSVTSLLLQYIYMSVTSLWLQYIYERDKFVVAIYIWAWQVCGCSTYMSVTSLWLQFIYERDKFEVAVYIISLIYRLDVWKLIIVWNKMYWFLYAVISISWHGCWFYVTDRNVRSKRHTAAGEVGAKNKGSQVWIMFKC